MTASKEAGLFVGRLLQRIMSALGIVIEVGKDIIASFIRWALQQLQAKLYRMASNVI